MQALELSMIFLPLTVSKGTKNFDKSGTACRRSRKENNADLRQVPPDAPAQLGKSNQR